MKNELIYVKAEIEIIEAGEDIIRTSGIDLPDIDLTEGELWESEIRQGRMKVTKGEWNRGANAYRENAPRWTPSSTGSYNTSTTPKNKTIP